MRQTLRAALRFTTIICAVYVLDGLPFAVGATACSELFDKTTISKGEGAFWNVLGKEEHNGAELIGLLSREAKLKKLFASSAGVFEGYSIKEHTLKVFEVFADQYAAYQGAYGGVKSAPDLRLFATLKFAIALHDIGKPKAILAGRKSLQHEYTIPILEDAFFRYGFSERETRLAKALVNNDILGHFVKGEIDTNIAKTQLVMAAAQSGLSVREFVPLQFLFYVSDAASYPFLRQNVFEVQNGLVTPKESLFQDLWAQIGAI